MESIHQMGDRRGFEVPGPHLGRGKPGVRARLFRAARALAWGLTILVTLAWVAVGRMGASVALLLEQPYGRMGVFNPTGHSALYFDHICAATPTSLRPCGPGELGSVISRYDGIGQYDWIAVPLVPYLYAVETAEQVPDSVDRLSALRTRDLYRRRHLQEVAPDTETGGMPEGNWYELVGSAYDRTMYGFRVKTTPEQDAGVIAYLNDDRNVTLYNGAFHNCADFTRVVLDRLYPHAVRRSVVADFGLTSPKSVARGWSRYARKHPELDLQTFTVPQVKGSLPRSRDVQGVSESLLKRYGLPLVVLSPHATALLVGAYVGRGRFDAPKDAPVLDVNELQQQATESIRLASSGEHGRPQTAEELARSGQELVAKPEPVVLLPVLGGGMGQTALIDGVACSECETVPFLP